MCGTEVIFFSKEELEYIRKNPPSPVYYEMLGSHGIDTWDDTLHTYIVKNDSIDNEKLTIGINETIRILTSEGTIESFLVGMKEALFKQQMSEIVLDEEK